LSLENVIDFFEILGALKEKKRSGWNSRLGIKNPESIADHSLRATIIAMCIGDLMKLNTDKLIRMLLLHDIQEAITGDFDYKAKLKLGLERIKRRQNIAIRQVLSSLPEELQSKYLSLWIEFENKETHEAILANDIDHLELIMQALEYERRGYNPKKFHVFWQYGKETIQTPLIQEMFKNLAAKRKKLGASSKSFRKIPDKHSNLLTKPS
jgi:putative hydrolase of HD superfamily